MQLMIFKRHALKERLSIGEVVRRLATTGTVTASGKPYGDRSVVWGILQNLAYMGRAAFGKTQSRDCLPRIRAQRYSAMCPRRATQQYVGIPISGSRYPYRQSSAKGYFNLFKSSLLRIAERLASVVMVLSTYFKA